MAVSLAEVLEHLVKGIATLPDEVRVDPSDLGRVIGRGGRTAQSLRTVIAALSDGRRVRIDVVDTDAEAEA